MKKICFKSFSRLLLLLLSTIVIFHSTSLAQITGSVTGKVTDATNNNAIAGATVSVGSISTTTDQNGNYRLDGIQAGSIRLMFSADVTSGGAPLTTQFNSDLREGTQTITVTANGYSNYSYNGLVMVTGQTVTHNISLSPRLTDAKLRFILTWGATPRDLDSHLRTPSGYKVYYSARGSQTSTPFAYLDVDDTDGYGPETVTIFRYLEGTYHYFIYRYSSDGELTASGAVVNIYGDDGYSRTLEVPTTGTGRYWYVATVNGSTGHVQIVNRIQTTEPGVPTSKDFAVNDDPKHEILNNWTYNWDFGDGQTSSLTNPTHTYQNPGLYTVSLTATNGSQTVTAVENSYIVVTGSGFGVVHGIVRNATNNIPIAGATVRLDGAVTTTNASGAYRFENVTASGVQVVIDSDVYEGYAALTVQFTSLFRSGFHNISASATGFDGYQFDGLVVHADQSTEHDISISPQLTNADIRFVLTWGATPRDLDSHLKTPTGYKVYYGARGSQNSTPFAYLDVDDTDGFGPETVTIFNLLDGTYHYFIYNYSGSPDITTSQAIVRIYNRNGATQVLNVPTTGTGRYWYVATIEGASGRISIINRIQATEPGVTGKELPMIPKFSEHEIATGWTYNWDFGDESTSNEANPVHTYLEPGVYTVSLTAYNGDTQASSVRSNMIEVVYNTSIDEIPTYTFRLLGSYPNPFNPVTNIRFELPESTMITLTVFNILGQIVMQSENQLMQSGYQHFQIDATSWSSGIYIYTIQMNEKTLSGKMALIK